MISEKNILQTDFEGEKNSCKEIPGEKKSYADQKSVMAYNAGKKSYTVVFQEKKGQKGQKSLTQTKSLIPPPPPQKSNGRHLKQPFTLS